MSWEHFAKLDFLGTSPFQNLCCREVRKFLPDLEFTEEGEAEKIFSASIPAAEVDIYLFFDSVLFRASTFDLLLQPADFDRPEDLVSRLIIELSNAI